MNRLTRERIEEISAKAALHYDAAESDVLSLCSMALEAVDGGYGAGMIAAERKRHVESEGWTAEHDSNHSKSEMTRAAISYARLAANLAIYHPDLTLHMPHAPSDWPWHDAWWKPSPDAIRNLVKAGALIAAEIDRLKTLPTPPASSLEGGKQ